MSRRCHDRTALAGASVLERLKHGTARGVVNAVSPILMVFLGAYLDSDVRGPTLPALYGIA